MLAFFTNLHRQLDPLSITSIARGGTTDFLDKLLENFPDWTFNAADKDLAGTFEIGVYQALGLSTNIGAELQLRYLPVSSYNPNFNYNPTPDGNELHWIQRVVNNHAITITTYGIIDLGHGTLEDKIDVFQKVLFCTLLVSLLFISTISANRQIEALNQFNFSKTTLALKNVSSDRVILWEQAFRGINKRPLLGWGFDGFGIAYPYITNLEGTPTVIRLGHFSFDYLDGNGELHTKRLPTYKAHNLILDTTLSTGILGLLTYLGLLGLSLYRVITSPYRGIEAVAVGYFVFTFTWFECAQFSHLVWWGLSLTNIAVDTSIRTKKLL